MATNYPAGPPELPDKDEPKPHLDALKPYGYKQPSFAVTSSEELEAPDALNEHVEEPGDPDGVIAEDEKRSWQESHPAPVLTPKAKKRKRRWPKVLIIILLIAAAGYGAFWYGNRKADQDAAKSAPAAQPSTKQQTKRPAVAQTKHYDSVTYTLGFDYPADWTLSDTAAKLTVTSPSLQLTTASGTKITGHVVVAIQNQQTAIAGFPADGALATIDSAKLTYKQPSNIQRAQTYLSYLGYGSADTLDALYITGDNGYLLGQQVPLSDVTKGNPLIGVSFVTCTDADCNTGTPTPVTLLASSWKSASFSTPVTTLLQSLVLD